MRGLRPVRRRLPDVGAVSHDHRVTGIDMPDPSLRDLRDRAKAASARAGAAGKRIMVFGCVNAVSPARIEGPGIVALDLPCIGMLPPTFIDWVLSRGLAEGVFVTGCRKSGCTSRFGVEWTDDRIDGKRDPRLRSRVPGERLGRLWAGKTEAKTLATEIRAFQARIVALPPTEKPAARSAAS
ncbi:MAG: hydrogenase iron-sulfur subunit [Alphaproteobacteria bacterium]|nr:hydrogenase iron-sulfur subunit [Alphaproteobacteria bacterium]